MKTHTGIGPQSLLPHLDAFLYSRTLWYESERRYKKKNEEPIALYRFTITTDQTRRLLAPEFNTLCALVIYDGLRLNAAKLHKYGPKSVLNKHLTNMNRLVKRGLAERAGDTYTITHLGRHAEYRVRLVGDFDLPPELARRQENILI